MPIHGSQLNPDPHTLNGSALSPCHSPRSESRYTINQGGAKMIVAKSLRAAASLSGVTTLLLAVTLDAAPPRELCPRSDLEFAQIASGLRQAINCAIPVCPTSTEGQALPAQDIEADYLAVWITSSFFGVPPSFTVAKQNQIIADARDMADQNAPTCINGKKKTPIKYQFRSFATWGNHYVISVRVTYACCSKALPK